MGDNKKINRIIFFNPWNKAERSPDYRGDGRSPATAYSLFSDVLLDLARHSLNVDILIARPGDGNDWRGAE